MHYAASSVYYMYIVWKLSKKKIISTKVIDNIEDATYTYIKNTRLQPMKTNFIWSYEIDKQDQSHIHRYFPKWLSNRKNKIDEEIVIDDENKNEDIQEVEVRENMLDDSHKIAKINTKMFKNGS